MRSNVILQTKFAYVFVDIIYASTSNYKNKREFESCWTKAMFEQTMSLRNSQNLNEILKISQFDA